MSFGVGVGDIIAVSNLIKNVVDCLKDSAGSSSEYREVLHELDDLQTALDAIDQLQVSSDRQDALKEIKVAALNCHFVLQAFLQKIESYGVLLDGNGAHSMRRGFKKIQWAAEMKHEVVKLQGYLAAHTGSINMRLITEGLMSASVEAEKAEFARQRLEAKVDLTNELVGDVKAEVQNISDKFDEVSQAKLLDRLSLLDFKQRQQDIYSRRQDDTSEWLLEDPTFLRWLVGDGPRSLFCPGGPGTGKTMMLSIVAEHINSVALSSDTALAIVYCDYNDAERQTAMNIVGCILKQLARQSNAMLRRVHGLFSKIDETNTLPCLSDFHHLLTGNEAYFKLAYVLIDGLDECPIETRELLFPIFRLFEKTPFRLLVTSRPNPDDILLHFNAAARIPIAATESDIRIYLEKRMLANSKFTNRITEPLFEKIVNSITARAEGMFLMAVLQLERICRERTASRISKVLQALPSQLENVYEDTFQRIRSQGEPDSTLAMRILCFMSCAHRQLSVRELTHALAIEWSTNAEPPKTFDFDNVLEPGNLTDVCGGLVLLEDQGTVVRFVHPTLEEYIRDHESSLFPNAHYQLAMVCMLYISLEHFDASQNWWDTFTLIYHKRGIHIGAETVFLPRDSGGTTRFSTDDAVVRLQEFPFLRYALSNWMFHVRQCKNSDSHFDQLIIGLLTKKPSLLLMPHVVRRDYRRPKYRRPKGSWLVASCRDTSSLHVAAQLGIPRIMLSVNEANGQYHERHTQCGMTAIHFAASAGNSDAIAVLLDNVDPDLTDELNRRPIHWASANGHSDVIRALVAHGADVNAQVSGFIEAESLYAPLHFAAFGGHHGAVTALLESGASIDMKDQHDFTPLGLAIRLNHVSTAKLLLDRGADRPIQPLSHKTMKDEFVEMVRMLLQHGIDPNTPDKYRHRPLRYAARWEQVRLVKLLLESGAECDFQDIRGESPLCNAACQTNSEVVDILCAHGADLQWLTPGGDTPLHLAAEIGAEGITSVLLRYGADVSLRNGEGSTPLHKACALLGYAERNCYAIVDSLCLHGADTTTQNDRGETPLHTAALSAALCRGNDAALPFFEAVIQLLCKHGADTNCQDAKGKTALHIAASDGLYSIVKILLANGSNPNAVDDRGKTALHIAALHGYEAMASTLLRRGADMSFRDQQGKTALDLASGGGRQVVVGLLSSLAT